MAPMQSSDEAAADIVAVGGDHAATDQPVASRLGEPRIDPVVARQFDDLKAGAVGKESDRS